MKVPRQGSGTLGVDEAQGKGRGLTHTGPRCWTGQALNRPRWVSLSPPILRECAPRAQDNWARAELGFNLELPTLQPGARSSFGTRTPSSVALGHESAPPARGPGAQVTSAASGETCLNIHVPGEPAPCGSPTGASAPHLECSFLPKRALPFYVLV